MVETNKMKEYNEVLAILDLIPSYDYYKIPSEIISGLTNNKVDNYEVIIKEDDFSCISRNAYLIFIKLYRDYIAEKDEKEKLNELLSLNDKKRNIEYDSFFDNKTTNNFNNEKIESNLIEIKRKNIIQKVIDKVKSMLKNIGM